MLKTVALVLPALIPSWRFFSTVEASPRIEYALGLADAPAPATWTEFRPRPDSIPFKAMLARLIWNAQWNENLYLVTCAERLVETPTEHAAHELRSRIARHLLGTLIRQKDETTVSFRLVFVARERDVILKDVLYTSAPVRLWDYADGV